MAIAEQSAHEAEVGQNGGRAGPEPPPVLTADSSVSFAELVWAHFQRQTELAAGEHAGEWEQIYRQRLRQFKDEHGDFFDAYWCRYVASGVALTEKVLPRRPRNLFGRDSIMRLHTATDWRTASAPAVAPLMHEWETIGIRAGEVLRGTSEKITLHRIFTASSRLLGFVDCKSPARISEGALAEVERAQKDELAAVTNYYARAGENSARIVYFRGMAWGAALLAAVVGASFLVGWAFGWLQPDELRTQAIFVTVAMGAAGAMLSVMTRMARTDGFNLDFEVGRKSVRFLGGLRPWIGAMFALALYLALKSGVLELLQGIDRTIYFYATIAFLAGFSERWAKVLLDGVSGDDNADRASVPTGERKGPAVASTGQAP